MKVNAREEIESTKTYVADKNIDELKKQYNISKVVKLNSNENPYGTSPKVKEAIKELVDSTNDYPDSQSYYLKEAIANKFNVKRENIVCGAGSDSLIKEICLTFLSKNDEVIMANITFERYKENTIIMGAIPIEVPLKDDKFDFEAMIKRINDKTKMIWLCNPNNPTGTIFTHEEFMNIIDKIPQDVLIVIDEAYGEFVESNDFPKTLELMKKHKNIILLKTFSKIYGLASLRVGYGIANEEITSYLNRVINPFDTNSYAQKAAEVAIGDNEFLNYVYENNKIQKHYLQDEFDKMGLKYLKSEASFIMVNVNGDDKPIYEYLLTKGFIIRPGFLLNMPNFIRVTIGKESENKEFIKLLKEAINYRDSNL